MSISRKNLKRLSFLLFLAAFTGGLFVYYETFYLPAFTLTALAMTGIVLVERYLNYLPPDAEELENWEKIRVRGRKKYLLQSLRPGLFASVIFVVFNISRNLMTDKPALDGVGVSLVIAAVIIGVTVYVNYEMWQFHEQRFKQPQASPDGAND